MNPQGEGYYDGISLDPLEVMFVKFKRVLVQNKWANVLQARKYHEWMSSQVSSHDQENCSYLESPAGRSTYHDQMTCNSQMPMCCQVEARGHPRQVRTIRHPKTKKSQNLMQASSVLIVAWPCPNSNATLSLATAIVCRCSFPPGRAHLGADPTNGHRRANPL